VASCGSHPNEAVQTALNFNSVAVAAINHRQQQQQQQSQQQKQKQREHATTRTEPEATREVMMDDELRLLVECWLFDKVSEEPSSCKSNCDCVFFDSYLLFDLPSF
jgi:hypothetical protein